MDRIGRYKIVRELGRGAMGIVYHANDPNIGRPVAIKTIQFNSSRKQEELDRMRERLFREARSAGILSHRGIVTIYDVDQQDELAYIAMEYVDGPTLEYLMSGAAALAADRMFSILNQTAVALDYAHSMRIVHRYIKPDNILVTADGTAKITDFGIAKITASEQFTMTGNIVGTPHYMSPEQVQGHPVDGRSDQFSLSVIAYEMLTGEKPYTGEHLTTVVYKIVAEEPASPRRFNPSLTLAIETALRKGLAKRPEARSRSCQEFVEALEKACAASPGWKLLPRSGTLSEPTFGEVPTARTKPKPAVTLPPPRRPARSEMSSTVMTKPRGGFVPFLLAILVAAGLLALIGWQAAPWLMPPRTTPTSPPPHTEPPQPKTQAQDQTPQPAQQPPTQAAAPPTAPAPQTTPPTAPAAEAAPPAERKPSPLGPAPADAPTRDADRPETRRAARPAPPAGSPQQVMIMTSPSGATARLDNNPALTCATPCMLQVLPGRHIVALTLRGYQLETREVYVANDPVEMAIVNLHASEGKLMLSSVPPGASVTMNGRRIDKFTNAQLVLAPGVYTVVVEMNGQQLSGRVEIRDGVTEYRKFTFSQ